MTITSIIPLDKRRCKVFFNEDFALVLYRGEVRRYHIEEGSTITTENYREIIELLCKRARERAFYLLKVSDKTELEIYRKLSDGGYPKEVIERTILFLKEYRFLDDESYGRRYINTYSDRRSRRRLSYDLQQKGLSRETISRLLEECPVEEQQQVELFLKKKNYNRDTTTPKERGKLIEALGRKGFSYEIISRVMGEELSD